MACLSSPTLAGNPSASFLQLEGKVRGCFALSGRGCSSHGREDAFLLTTKKVSVDRIYSTLHVGFILMQLSDIHKATSLYVLLSLLWHTPGTEPIWGQRARKRLKIADFRVQNHLVRF